MNNFKNYLAKSWRLGTNIDKFTVLFAATIGSTAHFCFYFLFKYYFGLYENLVIRGLATFFSLFLALLYFKKNTYKRIYLEVYWHMMLIWILPFVFTFNLLATNFHELWLYWEIFMIFVLIIFISHWLMFVVDLSIGIALAISVYALIFDGFGNLSFNHFNKVLYCLVLIFSSITGLFFAFATRITFIKAKHAQLTAIAGSIAHEMRSPISAILLSSQTLPDIDDMKKQILLKMIFNLLLIIKS